MTRLELTSCGRSCGRPRRQARGQALPEFALILPVLALVLLSILQIAVVIGTQIGLTNAAREAARIASVTVTADSAAAAVNGNKVLDRLRNVLLPTNVLTFAPGQLDGGDCSSGAGTRITYVAENDVGGKPAVFVRVDVVYRHPLFIPLVGTILDGLDGTPNDGFRAGASEELRVDNVPFESLPSGFPVCLP